jgi:hypothetical protein
MVPEIRPPGNDAVFKHPSRGATARQRAERGGAGESDVGQGGV